MYKKRVPMYQRIAEAVRQDILTRDLHSGDMLPSVRDMADEWGCTPGTVQRAYSELKQQGLVVSRPGQGTRVMTEIQKEEDISLRRVALIHQAEAFLLEVLTAGHSPTEVEQAVRLALDRWRAAVPHEPPSPPVHSLRFVGSHDPALALIVSNFTEVFPDYSFQLTFSGSLGGLIALAEGEADVAGSHLWDTESETYNRPFVQRLLPGRRVALLALAHRHLGLITPPGNPAEITGLDDLVRPELSFVNRQRGAGTRIWLDCQLRQRGLEPEQISGYEREVATHSEVAQAIAEGQADIGLGLETAAIAYHLGFVPLTTERYDLVMPDAVCRTAPAQALAGWLNTEEIKSAIVGLGGYDTGETGSVEWVE
ncbi:MAG: GntR family transcriptional regulator [Anaerolineaceae bacterium]|nr:MAG: GntR family transcriptional regulator [Anaerolineaceae bacterium]